MSLPPNPASPSEGFSAPQDKKKKVAQIASPKPTDESGKFASSHTVGSVHDKAGSKPVSTNQERADNAPNADKKTTAAAPDGNSFPRAAQQVGLDSILPKMAKAMSGAGAAAGAQSPAFQTSLLLESYYNALKLLIKDYTYVLVAFVIDEAFKNGKEKFLDELVKDKVITAHYKIYNDYLEYGEFDIPILEFNKVNTIGETPPNLVTNVPHRYYQEYYTFGMEPYPGYIEWRKMKTDGAVYTARNIGDDFYELAEDEVVALSMRRLYKELKNYFIEKTLTVPILNKILLAELQNLKDDLREKAIGKGSSAGGGGGGMDPSIIGPVAISMVKQLKVHLPRSVLKKKPVTVSQIKKAQNHEIKETVKLKLVPATEENLKNLAAENAASPTLSASNASFGG